MENSFDESKACNEDKGKFITLSKLSVLILVVVLSNCSDPEPKPQSPVVGKWDWVKSIGGFTGNFVFTPASTGHHVQYIFRKDSTFLQIDNGVTVQDSKFIIDHDKLKTTGEPADIIIIQELWWTTGSQGQDSSFIIEFRNAFTVEGDTLRFITDNVDSYRHWYKKIK